MNYTTFEDAWIDTLTKLTCAPAIESRVGSTMELTGHRFSVSDISRPTIRVREMSSVYAAAEMLWYLSGTRSGKMIVHYAPSYAQFLDSNGETTGAYGWRMKNQIAPLIALLKSDPNTRRAVIGLWSTDDIGQNTPDQPCTLSLQFILRHGFLDCIVTMRSNDVWLGTVYDTFCFSRLQTFIANELGVYPGHYTHQVGSMHLYAKNSVAAARVLQFGRRDGSRLEFDGYTRPRGSFLDAAAEAVKLEEFWRKTKSSTPADVMDAVAHSNLLGTELGALVLLCSAKNYGLETLREFVRIHSLNVIDPELLV